MTVQICPIIIKGISTGRAPIHVKIIMMATKIQNEIFINGFKAEDAVDGWLVRGRVIKIKIEATRAMTPPNLFGIERKIA